MLESLADCRNHLDDFWFIHESKCFGRSKVTTQRKRAVFKTKKLLKRHEVQCTDFKTKKTGHHVFIANDDI